MQRTLSKTTIGAVAALSIALASAMPAQALGRNERNVLKGIVGTLLVQEFIRSSRRNQAAQQPRYVERRYYQPAYTTPAPRSTYSVYSTPAAQAFNSYSYSERRIIQSRLSNWGYYNGSIDGAFGPRTYSAIQAYAGSGRGADRLRSVDGAYGVYDELLRS
ncbi:MAG: peptidoglycan-binding protein [Paracoccaceae bacterium]